MKYVLLAIFVLIAAQPLQASECDMHNGQGATEGLHADMNHNDMQDMDCCDSESQDSMHQCDSMSHCGACTAGVVALDPHVAIAAFMASTNQYLSDTGKPLSHFNSPPFRPPIS
jgi:uncharacterized protein involved in copper resistance